MAVCNHTLTLSYPVNHLIPKPQPRWLPVRTSEIGEKIMDISRIGKVKAFDYRSAGPSHDSREFTDKRLCQMTARQCKGFGIDPPASTKRWRIHQDFYLLYVQAHPTELQISPSFRLPHVRGCDSDTYIFPY